MNKTSNEWLSVQFTLLREQAAAAEDLLWQLGAVSVTLIDAADQPIHEPGPGETPLWSALTIDALFDGTADPEPLQLRLLASGLIAKSEDIQLSSLDDQDWARAWMDRFEPMQFGDGLWICPSHLVPDPAWPTVIRLDPGLAFGSGTHPTTSLCLEWLSEQDLTGTSVIDYGSGSGVLAIAAALKGAESILAIDHDPQALEATLDNARRNDVADRIRVALPKDVASGPVDIVLANILAGPLIELAPELTGLLRPGGSLILSGILAEQAESVALAYRAQLGFEAKEICQEWVRLVFAADTGQ
ncbi:MAG: 50S ribosomal protein L11 methyltransferase [Pseudomonadota bacterium]